MLPVPMPCLIVDPDGITEEGDTILLDSKGNRLTQNIEAFGSNLRFALTWQGWILSSDPNNLRTFLSNPETLDKIELPHFTHQLPRRFECALSDKPTSHGCVVVVLPLPDEATLWYCCVGGDKWTKYDYNVGSQQYDTKGLVWKKIVIRHLTPCKGKFYFPMSTFRHGALEFNPHPITRVMTTHGIPKIVPPNPCGYSANVCCFELDDEPCQFLAYNYKDPLIITSIALFKMDTAGQRWNQVTDIGDRALLWSGNRGGCCSAIRFGLEPNNVYWMSPNDGSLMRVFNILERTQKVCDPPKDLPRLSSEAFWLLPSC